MELLEKEVISPPCAVVLLRFPLLVVKVPVALVGNGATVTLTDMELLGGRTVELSAVAQATTPEDTRQESLQAPRKVELMREAQVDWGRALTQDDEGRQHHGVWSQTDAALEALRLPGRVRLLRAQK